jgi:ATP-dependent RNA helicase HrpB
VSPDLPVAAALPALRQALIAHGAAVLQAPPGAGKSTLVPLALLDEPWAKGRRLLLLEPRRLAARAIAARMAHTLGESVGGTVGYRMRLDTRVSAATRIEVVTEGVLTRLLQDDPSLEGVAGVLFDEFHERSLQADLGLALALDARDTLAPELRLLVMSATLEGAAVARLLKDAPLLSAQGRAFTVETHYAGQGLPALSAGPAATRAAQPWDRLIASLIRRALREQPGDVLVFLPGAREIRRVESLLAATPLPPDERIAIVPLYGELSGEEQDAALAPAAAGTRKVVLATNIAETSLTIPGVRAVVDSGLMRRARFDPVTGMSRLETQRISRASAEQRQGRAGRTAGGVCLRAWSAGAHQSLAAFTAAEIMEADLAPLALELASWGVREAAQLRWLDAPPPAMLASARDLLTRLGALEAGGRISAHGREMARLGVHPRLAHMLLRARALGAVPLAAQLAALLSERDLLRGGGRERDADLRTRLDLLSERASVAGAGREPLRRVRRLAGDLERQLAADEPDRRGEHGTHAGRSGHGAADAGLLLAFAYPDRIALRRAGGAGRFTLANGRGAEFAYPQALAREELIVAVELDDRDRDARILLAAPLRRRDLEQHFADDIRRRESVAWSSREQAVLARRTSEFGALVLEEKPLATLPAQAALDAMLTGVRELGIEALPWNDEARDLQARIEFVRTARGDTRPAQPPWPAVSDAALRESLESWLAPWLQGVTRREHLARVPLGEALRARLTAAQQRELVEWAPTHLELPGGTRLRVEYRGEAAPAVAVKLQQVFGVAETPRLGRGRVPVTFRLLSPAQRPVQVTRDLASFWRGAYAEVRKDLRGRYPKHDWPEDPLAAPPSRGPRRAR